MKKVLNLVIFIYLINPIFPTTHFDDKSEKILYIHDEPGEKPMLIENSDHELVELINQRYKRDLTTSDRYENNKNISVKVNAAFFRRFPTAGQVGREFEFRSYHPTPTQTH